MRILSWNINGLATVLHYHPWNEKKSYESMLNALEADIICLQEIKCQRNKLTRDMALVPGYDGYFTFSKIKLGYSGVAIYVKQPLRPYWTEQGITGILNTTMHSNTSMDDFLSTLSTEARDLDAEGRCIIMCLGQLVLINVYLPNESRGQFKTDYDACVRWRIDDFLQQGKHVVLVGDINTVHEEIDHCDPANAIKKRELKSFNDLPFRGWIDQLIAPKGPMLDLCRKYHPDRKGMFTCWNTRLNSRPANFGVRIDYVLASCGLEQEFTFADIRNDIMGSDHCPVYADLRDDSCVISNASDSEPSAILAANFDEFSNRQKKLSMYFGAKSTTTDTSSSNHILASPPQSTKSSIGPSTTTTTTTASRPTTIRSKSTTSSSSSSPKKRKSSVSTTSRSQKLLKSYFTSSNSDKESTPNPSSSSTATTSDDAPDDVVVEENNDEIDMEALMAEAKERQDTKASWSSLFTAKPPPKCRVHQEPCKLMVVNKKGPNQGRQFYLCSRPYGPENSTGNEYQCNFFQWKTSSQEKSNPNGK
ncbi:dnase i-like protein [Lichtheimia corymbifera JMRC:FSU:9682]|uniref:DNA-(apurinic or apyrimidinic site) endonuclease n=1 Tax=Lichtheimia corymbifera JMRC:FSU:9682 TaxID=1263082 RepID=A0A068RT24_9FUNG|nr:dnase i-like protein [Lichtheimia corymbifera JMRC:FSU:9682]